VTLPSVPRSFFATVLLAGEDGQPIKKASASLIQALPCLDQRGFKWSYTHPVLDCTFHPVPLEVTNEGTVQVTWDDQGKACVVARQEEKVGVLVLENIGDAKRTLVLLEAASLSGRALVKGEPAPGALVAVWDGEAFSETVRADESGMFTFSRLPPGRYHAGALVNGDRISGEPVNYLPAPRSQWTGVAPAIEIQPGERLQIDVAAVDSRSASIHVRLKPGGAQFVILRRSPEDRPRDLFDVVGQWSKDTRALADGLVGWSQPKSATLRPSASAALSSRVSRGAAPAWRHRARHSESCLPRASCLPPSRTAR
jgi:hypothetical protein